MENYMTYTVYKKRDGQSFKEESSIYAASFSDACKIFAKQMTDDNHSQSNNIQWLDKVQDGVFKTGWYDFNGGSATFNEETEKYNADEAADFLLVSEEAIKEGFSSWNEDVYTWEVRDKFEVEIWCDGEFHDNDFVESIDQAEEIYPACDGYEIREK